VSASLQRHESEGQKRQKTKKKACLLGLGLDGKDGHTRITTGENFKLVGGSEETHGVMQEKAVKVQRAPQTSRQNSRHR